jgi:hypothetical protein
MANPLAPAGRGRGPLRSNGRVRGSYAESRHTTASRLSRSSRSSGVGTV